MVLTACVPSSTRDTTVVGAQTLGQRTSFFPQEPGTLWQYLPEGSTLSGLPVVRTVEGPRVVNGERYVMYHSLGRGMDVRSYRQITRDGVFLVRQEGPGYVLELSPPIQEYPAPDLLGVGHTWQGSSSARIRFAEALNGQNTQTFTTNYSYTVVDKRRVQTNIGQFEVFVINIESQRLDADGIVTETLNQERWFTPYVGDIKTEQDMLLVASNIGN